MFFARTCNGQCNTCTCFSCYMYQCHKKRRQESNARHIASVPPEHRESVRRNLFMAETHAMDQDMADHIISNYRPGKRLYDTRAESAAKRNKNN